MPEIPSHSLLLYMKKSNKEILENLTIWSEALDIIFHENRNLLVKVSRPYLIALRRKERW